MLVAVFLFTIVMFVAMAAVLALIDTNRKNQNIKSVVNNLTLVVSSISKNIAVSTGYYCGEVEEGDFDYFESTDYKDYGADCAGSDPSQALTMRYNEDGTDVGIEPDIYRYKFVVTDDAAGTGTVYRSISGGDYFPITAPEVKITRFDFYVMNTQTLVVPINGGAAFGDTRQPRVLLIIEGYAGAKETSKSSFRLQTTISQRSLDVIYE